MKLQLAPKAQLILKPSPDIQKMYAFDGSGKFIYRKHCPNGADFYYLYSASGADGTWELRAARAWEQHDKLKQVA